MYEIILQAENLSHAYPDGTRALDGINLRIEKRHKTFFHGANGAGKTTLFQCLNGLLDVEQGTVRIHGEIVKKGSERMRRIGLVFQNASDQIIAGSVFEEVAFGPLHQGLAFDIVTKKVEMALQVMGIVHLRDRPPHFLSYGEKKRVTIASILSMDQEIVILDEPASGLDAGQKEELVSILDRLTQEGRTLLISTHDADFSFRCADRIVVLDQGRMICEGDAEEVFSRSDVLQKTGIVKPILMAVHEKLIECGFVPPERAPRDMKGLSRILQRRENE